MPPTQQQQFQKRRRRLSYTTDVSTEKHHGDQNDKKSANFGHQAIKKADSNSNLEFDSHQKQLQQQPNSPDTSNERLVENLLGGLSSQEFEAVFSDYQPNCAEDQQAGSATKKGGESSNQLYASCGAVLAQTTRKPVSDSDSRASSFSSQQTCEKDDSDKTESGIERQDESSGNLDVNNSILGNSCTMPSSSSGNTDHTTLHPSIGADRETRQPLENVRPFQQGPANTNGCRLSSKSDKQKNAFDRLMNPSTKPDGTNLAANKKRRASTSKAKNAKEARHPTLTQEYGWAKPPSRIAAVADDSEKERIETGDDESHENSKSMHRHICIDGTPDSEDENTEKTLLDDQRSAQAKMKETTQEEGRAESYRNLQTQTISQYFEKEEAEILSDSDTASETIEDEPDMDLGMDDLDETCRGLTQCYETEANIHPGPFRSFQSDKSLDFIDYKPPGPDGIGQRRYYIGETWHTKPQDCLADVKKLYKIEGFRTKGRMSKIAVCEVSTRLSDRIGTCAEDIKICWVVSGREEIELNKLKCQLLSPEWKHLPYRCEYNFRSIKDAESLECGTRKTALSFRWAISFIRNDFVQRQKMVRGKPTVLELFGGIGGMSLGLERAGFSITSVVENDPITAHVFQANFPGKNVIVDCVKAFLKRCRKRRPGYPGKSDFNHLHGSTPCQPFSKACREKDGGKDGPAKKELVYTFVSAVAYFEPDTASFENVTGFLAEEHREYLTNMLAGLLREIGYNVRVCVLNSANYGDAQDRHRVFLFASKAGIHLPLEPTVTHGRKEELLRLQTVKHCLKDLEDIEPESGQGRVQLETGAIVDNHSM